MRFSDNQKKIVCIVVAVVMIVPIVISVVGMFMGGAGM